MPIPPGVRALLVASSFALLCVAVPRAHAAPARTTAPAAAFDTLVTADSTDMIALGMPPSGARDYLAEARKGFTADNREYQRLRTLFRLVSPLVSILAGVLLLTTGVAQRFRDIALAGGKGRWARVLIFFTLYIVTLSLVLLPLAWYQGYALERRFGFATQTPIEWLIDELKALGFQIVAFGVVPLFALAWRAVETSPRRWWLWLASGTLPVVLAGVVLQPLVFDPLFNKFTPLRDLALRDQILALGARAHVPARNVYEVDMSEKTTKVNAYVSGFGTSQRIVLWDTTLRRMAHDEILFVMGHEMGHYVLQHIWRGVLLYSLGAFLAFWLVYRIVRGTLAEFGERWRVRDAGDLAAIPLVLAAFGLVSFLAAPVTNALSRQVEHEADIYALEITHDNDAGARSFLALARDNKSDPEPPAWVRLVLYSHPPLGERIRFALEYKPWERGEPNRAYREK